MGITGTFPFSGAVDISGVNIDERRLRSLVDISGVIVSNGKIPVNGPVDISGITVSNGRISTISRPTTRSFNLFNPDTEAEINGISVFNGPCTLRTLFVSNRAIVTKGGFCSIYDLANDSSDRPQMTLLGTDSKGGALDTFGVAYADRTAQFTLLSWTAQGPVLNVNHTFLNGIVVRFHYWPVNKRPGISDYGTIGSISGGMPSFNARFGLYVGPFTMCITGTYSIP